MDNLSNPFNGTVKKHWRRRQYRRLDGTTPNKKKIMITRLGGRPRRLWRIKAVPKLQLKMGSPSKLWKKFKNAYIKMMLSLAGNVGSMNSGDVFRGNNRISMARPVQVSSYSKDEFESRLVFEIYKSLMASKELGTSIT